MQVLFESLYNKFTGSTGVGSLYALLGGRMHFTEAPQGSAYPYGVYTLISNVPSWIFGADENIGAVWHINITHEHISVDIFILLPRVLIPIRDHRCNTLDEGIECTHVLKVDVDLANATLIHIVLFTHMAEKRIDHNSEGDDINHGLVDEFSNMTLGVELLICLGQGGIVHV